MTLQDCHASRQGSVDRQNATTKASGKRAKKDIDRAALHAVTLAEIVKVRSFDIVATQDRLVPERLKKALDPRELAPISNAGQNLLPDWTDDNRTFSLNGLTELFGHLLLMRA